MSNLFKEIIADGSYLELEENCSELSNQYSSEDFTEDNHRQGNELEKQSNLEVINIYDFEKSLHENLQQNPKNLYILMEVKSPFGDVEITNNLPTPQSKCLVNIEHLEKYDAEYRFNPTAYTSFMGVEVLNFMKYSSVFFTCDERVMFIFLLVKFKCFDFKPFYWSKNKMFNETGIKKDRAKKILEKFKNLEILSSEIKRKVVNNRPSQITYFNLNCKRIIELLPEIMNKDKFEDDVLQEINHDIKSYLHPGLDKKEVKDEKNKTSLSNILQ